MSDADRKRLAAAETVVEAARFVCASWEASSGNPLRGTVSNAAMRQLVDAVLRAHTKLSVRTP